MKANNTTRTIVGTLPKSPPKNHRTRDKIKSIRLININLLTLIVSDEGYSRNVSCGQNYHCVK